MDWAWLKRYYSVGAPARWVILTKLDQHNKLTVPEAQIISRITVSSSV